VKNKQDNKNKRETLFPDWDLGSDDSSAFAIEYFKKKKLPYDEATMIDCLKNRQSKYELYWAISALRLIGTVKSIEYLKDVVTYKNLDVQGASVLTIAQLADGTENGFLGQLLLNRDFKAKWYAVVAFNYKANDKAVPYALEYGLKSIKSSKNQPEAGTVIVEYLARYAPENKLSQKIFARINNDFENLFPRAKEVYTKEFPDIFNRLSV
jgi:hypothetical protein